jgi:hypothetical protein
MEDNNVLIVIKINLGALLTSSDQQPIYKVLFAKEVNKTPNIQTLIHKLCIGMRVKTTFKENDNEDELLIYWRYSHTLTTLQNFESQLISVYEESKDIKFKLLDRNAFFKLISTNTVKFFLLRSCFS